MSNGRSYCYEDIEASDLVGAIADAARLRGAAAAELWHGDIMVHAFDQPARPEHPEWKQRRAS
jgi:hypothetical protein